METNKVKKMIDEYVEKQYSSYKASNNYARCFHRFQGYIACLIDLNLVDIDERSKVLDYMCDKLGNIE